MRADRMKIFFDGGCRPNPGTMETAIVARGVTYHRADCGHGSNNDAEWLALIHAVEIAMSIDARDVVMLGDSAMVVAQANGHAPCRAPTFRQYLSDFRQITINFNRIIVRKIPRNQNLAGIALAATRR